MEKANEEHDRRISLIRVAYELDGVRSNLGHLAMLEKVGLAGPIRP